MEFMDGRRKAETIRDRCESGEYRVEPEKVADRMVRDAVRRIRERQSRGEGGSRPGGRDQAK